MNIHHEPVFSIKNLESYFKNIDGQDIKYVCTSAIHDDTNPCDILYRETPHPKFGNHYVGVYLDIVKSDMVLVNADYIETMSFGMILADKKWKYSRHRHDCITHGSLMVDGGRAYVRGWGYSMFKMKDGNFIPEEQEKWAWQDSGIENAI